MKRPKGKRCKNCEHYPNDCAYWDMKKRKKENATYITPETIHNCSDFKVKKAKLMNPTIEQQIGDLEAKIASAANKSGGGADEESRIDDMFCQLSTLEQKLDEKEQNQCQK